MQSQFKINWDYYYINQSKLIYTENRVKEKVLQYLEPCLYVNLITSFVTIKDLFNYSKNIVGNFYQKKYVIKKFRELKMSTSPFNNFYFEFVRLALNLENTFKMFI